MPRLTWNGNISAQVGADKAYQEWRKKLGIYIPKRKLTKEEKRKLKLARKKLKHKLKLQNNKLNNTNNNTNNNYKAVGHKNNNQRIKPLPPNVRPEWIPYNEYLETPWWKQRRLDKLKLQRWICQRCGSKATLVHHLHYRTLWRERNKDLEALCDPCHKIEHEALVTANSHMSSILRTII